VLWKTKSDGQLISVRGSLGGHLFGSSPGPRVLFGSVSDSQRPILRPSQRQRVYRLLNELLDASSYPPNSDQGLGRVKRLKMGLDQICTDRPFRLGELCIRCLLHLLVSHALRRCTMSPFLSCTILPDQEHLIKPCTKSGQSEHLSNT